MMSRMVRDIRIFSTEDRKQSSQETEKTLIYFNFQARANLLKKKFEEKNECTVDPMKEKFDEEEILEEKKELA